MDREEAPDGEGGTKNHMTDSQLIQEIKQGNTELYSELMRRYQRKILAFVYHMLKVRTWSLWLKIYVRKHFIRHSGVCTHSGKWMHPSRPGSIP